MEKSSWSTGLARIGQHYEGIIENVESILEFHTVTTYGTRTSFKSSKSNDDKENNSFNSNNCSNEKMVSIKKETMM